MVKGGKKGGGKSSRKNTEGTGDDFVLEFTPDPGFDINHSAPRFSQMMEDRLQPLIIHLPYVSVEFEPGCTPDEIIDGYNQALKHKFSIKHSNSNIEAPKKGL